MTKVIRANNSRQIPSEDWADTIWLLRNKFYSYNKEEDKWILIPKGSQEFKFAVKAWDSQRNNATPIKTSV